MPNVIQMKKDYLNGTAVFHTLSDVHGAGSKSLEGVWGLYRNTGLAGGGVGGVRGTILRT